MFFHTSRVCVPTRMLGAMAAVALLWAPLASAESPSSPVAMNHQLPAWAEQLKGQTIVEDAMSGRGERSAMVEQQHQRDEHEREQDHRRRASNDPGRDRKSHTQRSHISEDVEDHPGGDRLDPVGAKSTGSSTRIATPRIKR